jgi:serine/threonine-protein kinase
MSDTTTRPPVASLPEDQRRRWQAGERVPVEDYLAAHPGLADDALLDLIFQEVVLRERRGETPPLDEYVRRFPRLAETLRLQFSVDRALWESSSGSEDLDPSTRSTVRGAVPAPPGDLPHLDGYEILDLLGRGGMGVVYKAWHLPLKRLVALKMIRSPGQAGSEELARFRTEAEAFARLQHPNIVQVHEVGEQRGCPYLALEYVGGGSLANRLDGTPWPARRRAGPDAGARRPARPRTRRGPPRPQTGERVVSRQ